MSVLPAFILFLCITSSLTQTFQYSQGWTNGKKRSTSLAAVHPLPQLLLDLRLPPSLMLIKAFRHRKVRGNCKLRWCAPYSTNGRAQPKTVYHVMSGKSDKLTRSVGNGSPSHSTH